MNEIVRGPAQSAYLGYWVGAPYTRRGYMTEALPLALSHAFLALGLHRVEANIMPTNRPSLALVRRPGEVLRHVAVRARRDTRPRGGV